jgi:hypothetical protein
MAGQGQKVGYLEVKKGRHRIFDWDRYEVAVLNAKRYGSEGPTGAVFLSLCEPIHGKFDAIGSMSTICRENGEKSAKHYHYVETTKERLWQCIGVG